MKAILNKEPGMIPKPPERVVTITDTAALAESIERLRACDWVAVDTEFLRERTYYPRLCLVQLADAEHIVLVDVLAIDNLAPLAELLLDPDVLKVFHAAEQDLEVLYQRFGALPAPVFDTQIAAALVGFDDQMGYARLIAALLDIDLPKAHTRTDWSKRPLAEGALGYAADDVRYLAVAYAVLVDRLAAAGRSAWLAEDCARLQDPARFEPAPDTAWKRLKNRHRLAGGQQQVLAEIAAWREREAVATDRPRKWILGDDALMEIARRQPADAEKLNAIRALPAKTASRHGDALVDCVARAAARPAEPLDDSSGPPSPREKALIRAGMERLEARAESAGIASARLASRREVARLVDGERDTPLLTGWRAAVAGDAVVEAIEAAAADLDAPT
ncbi:ribonuclease D [Salinisphaera orenii]|uniref:Ribonuclease D n=1 Tax=Salinisphaera orenii YIM 95161 TaxID=1051139 RepID=A0A423QBA1_9GAMM|nr:ribonuclease D [Salinisphaera halophila]ROO37697.1 ribonuclease D [Salinisphaera halophila YIM 95161]